MPDCKKCTMCELRIQCYLCYKKWENSQTTTRSPRCPPKVYLNSGFASHK